VRENKEELKIVCSIKETSMKNDVAWTLTLQRWLSALFIAETLSCVASPWSMYVCNGTSW
jgi:hypothetical protein